MTSIQDKGFLDMFFKLDTLQSHGILASNGSLQLPPVKQNTWPCLDYETPSKVSMPISGAVEKQYSKCNHQ
jgi:hypothetical protein